MFPRLTKLRRLFIFPHAFGSCIGSLESYVKIEGSQTRSEFIPEKGKTQRRNFSRPLGIRREKNRRRFAERLRRGACGKNQGTRPPRAGAGASDLQRHQRGVAGKCRDAGKTGRGFFKAARAGNRDRGPGGRGQRQETRAEEEDTARLDALDDPVRMYLKQMGQVALLTREQEVEISKRIEAAEAEVDQNHLQPRFCRQGTHRARGKTAGRPAARTV